MKRTPAFSFALNRALAAALSALLSAALVCALLPATAFAVPSNAYLTLGADLDEDEQADILSSFGLDEDDLDDLAVITVSNAQEREYLEDLVSEDVIGTRTLSCSYVQITSSGGIEVETANLTYVTESAIYNALQTAGIDNCTVAVTAPTEVSGTGALTGIFLAVERATGTDLDEDKKEIATEELLETSDLEDEYGSDVSEVIGDVKDAVASAGDDLDADEIEDIVIAKADEYDVELTDDDVESIVALVQSIQDLDYDADAFADTLSSLSDTSGIVTALQNAWSAITRFFSGIFSGKSLSDSASILDSLDTDVFDLDTAE